MAAVTVRKLKLPIPVTIVTGGLGTGKTTVLRHLVANKPPEEHWAIVVNEFGAVGIDGAAIEAAAADSGGGRTVVRQIAGGCMCCVTLGLLSACIAQIIRQTKPDRLLLEPSGLGHPGGLVDVLRGEHLRSALHLNAIICLVDLSCFDPPALEGVGVISDQIAIADILVGSKADLLPGKGVAGGGDHGCRAEADQAAAGDGADALLEGPGAASPLLERELAPAANASAAGHDKKEPGGDECGRASVARGGVPGTVAAFKEWAGSMYPPKCEVLVIDGGRLDPAVLDRPRSSAFATLTAAWRQPGGRARRRGGGGGGGATNAAAAGAPAPAAAEDQLQEQPEPPAPRAPTRVLRPGDVSSDGHAACGWVFHESDVFDRPRLLGLLRALRPPRVARAKGVFRVGPTEWVLPSVVLGGNGFHDVALTKACYRGQSCAEVILTAAANRVANGAGEAGSAADTVAANCEAASGKDMERRVAAAVLAAIQGDFGPLDLVFLDALVAT